MDYYVQAQRSSATIAGGIKAADSEPAWPIQHALPMADHPSIGEGMWQLNMHSEGMEPNPGFYPEHPGEPDCAYYMRTGLCGFGMSCRFNHPRNRQLVSATGRGRGEYPERMGQPECQYYLKTGTCKFGATCKYHHPRDKGGQSGKVQLNILGFPLRLGEKECAYYMRTGSCKYGVTCKFHHPQPATAYMSVPNSPLYPTAGSPSTPVAQHFPPGLSSWPITRTPYLASPRLQAPGSFAPLIIPPQGIVSVAGWSAYRQGPMTPLTPDGQQPSLGPGYIYGGGRQAESVGSGIQGSLSPFSPGAIGISTPQFQSGTLKDSMFPERPGQQECQYYMKTGDCKFGATCRYHHPKDRGMTSATCILSSMGLPLRPGAPLCNYYNRYGICKFGPTCKFDHPLIRPNPNISAASFLTEMGNVMAYPGTSPLSPSSISGEIPLSVLPSSKDLSSVSRDSTAHESLGSKGGYEKVEENISLSSESAGTSLMQVGQSMSAHTQASTSLLGNENRADVASAS